MAVFGLLFAAVAGLLNAVQAGANATLGKIIGPFPAALAILGVSGVVFVTVGAATGRLTVPAWGQVAAVPWWGWIGGAFGALFVMAQLFTAEKLGSAVFMATTVTAAVIMSLALDHFGLVGFKQHSAGLGRFAGAALMLAGLALIAKY